jgi:diaminopimelate decarboxylase
VSVEARHDARSGCAGVVALPARLEPWQTQLCTRPDELLGWMDAYGSPLNLLDPSPLGRNAAELHRAAASAGVELRIYFARKANKALAFVDEAWRLGLGIDLASERELAQALARGVPGRALVMTAAVKPAALLRRCVASGTTVAVDNADELALLGAIAAGGQTPVPIALRLAPQLPEDRLQTRFGVGVDEAIALVDAFWPLGARSQMTIAGVHFHLDGYDAGDRVAAIGQAIELVDELRHRGHAPAFVDVGGGIPMSYLESATQWERFWLEHRRGLLGQRAPLTFEGHGLGLLARGGEILGRPAVYPFHQEPTRGAWLSEVLAGRVRCGADERSVAQALRGRGLQLRCEPGRALLDGCGLTVARVAHRKQRRDGTWLIGVQMNRTQCRSTSEDFLVDPLLLRPSHHDRRGVHPAPTPAIEGYLVGAYCIERELLTWRRLCFPHGVAVDDVVVFPNTAGYLMHILESSSHQIPLAANLLVRPDGPPTLDAIDHVGDRSPDG